MCRLSPDRFLSFIICRKRRCLGGLARGRGFIDQRSLEKYCNHTAMFHYFYMSLFGDFTLCTDRKDGQSMLPITNRLRLRIVKLYGISTFLANTLDNVERRISCYNAIFERTFDKYWYWDSIDKIQLQEISYL